MEPKRPIERLLQAYAQRRRRQAGPPFEPHPASRRLWAGEVNRQYAGARRAQGGPGWLPGWVPRIAWGAAALAVLGLGFWFLSTGGNQPPAEYALVKDLHSPANKGREEMVTRKLAPAATPAPADFAAPARDRTVGMVIKQETPALDLTRRSSGEVSGQGGGAEKERLLATASAPAPVALESAAQAAKDNALGDFPKRTETLLTTNLGFGLAAAGTPTQPGTGSLPSAPAPTMAVSAGNALTELHLNGALTNTIASLARAADKEQLSFAEATKAPVQTWATAAPSEPLSLGGVGSPKAGAGFLYQTGISQDDAAKLSVALKEKGLRAVQQQFIQVAADDKGRPANRRAPSTTPILNNFTVEQTGAQWRVIDEDGSVYLGYSQESESPPGTAGARTAPRATRVAGGTAGARVDAPAQVLLTDQSGTSAGRFFRVVGTNRSLNQKVVFTGTVLPPPNVAMLADTNAVQAFGGQFKASSQSAAIDNFLQQSQIRGKAQIGDRREIEINAAPAKP